MDSIMKSPLNLYLHARLWEPHPESVDGRAHLDISRVLWEHRLHAVFHEALHLKAERLGLGHLKDPLRGA